ncbi:MAG: hypothetical protein EHM28_05140 [Spirochaetaceae bacterium]|nr:MAG: hypothetical protein EHM28_05140 [Spirochaetaceae bacterium]
MKKLQPAIIIAITIALIVTAAFLSCSQSIEVDAETVPDPQFSLAAGPYNSPQDVSFTYPTDPTMIIYYTTDGSDPAISGTRTAYTANSGATFEVNAVNGTVTTVRAIATKTSYANSDEVSRRYAIVWKELTPLDIAISDFGVTVIDSNIYLIGGFTTVYQDTVYEYNTITKDTTEKSATFSTARKDTTAITMNDLIYAFGGRTSGAALKELKASNSGISIWTDIDTADFTARFAMGAGEIESKVYVVGGRTVITPATATNITQVFDIAAAGSDKWSDDDNMAYARYSFGYTVYSKRLYIIGGFTSTSQSSKFEVFDPALSSGSRWSDLDDMPTARSSFGAATVNGKIYAIGGATSASTICDTVEEYDISASSWALSPKTPMPETRKSFGIAVVNDNIYILGGYNASDNACNTVYIYDPVEDHI